MSELYAIQTQQDWTDKVQMAKGKVLVEFFATWCGYCKRQQPVLEECIGEINSLGATVVQVDIDKFPEQAAQYQVTGTPTFVLFEDGIEVNRHPGIMDAQEFAAFIR